VQVACDISLESFRRGLQLFVRLNVNWRFARKVMGLQSGGSPNLGISKLPLGSFETKCHLDACLVASHRVYYKRKVVTSSSLGYGESCEFKLAVVHLSIKSVPICTNQLVIWFV